VLTEFSIKAITEGIDAVGDVTIRIEEEGTGNGTGHARRNSLGDHRKQTYTGHGVHTDILVAAAHAYMGALNKLLAARQARVRVQASAYTERNTPAHAVDLFGNSTLGRGA
jgi:2-isopropylmalate synthase